MLGFLQKHIVNDFLQ